MRWTDPLNHDRWLRDWNIHINEKNFTIMYYVHLTDIIYKITTHVVDTWYYCWQLWRISFSWPVISSDSMKQLFVLISTSTILRDLQFFKSFALASNRQVTDFGFFYLFLPSVVWTLQTESLNFSLVLTSLYVEYKFWLHWLELCNKALNLISNKNYEWMVWHRFVVLRKLKILLYRQSSLTESLNVAVSGNTFGRNFFFSVSHRVKQHFWRKQYF